MHMECFLSVNLPGHWCAPRVRSWSASKLTHAWLVCRLSPVCTNDESTNQQFCNRHTTVYDTTDMLVYDSLTVTLCKLKINLTRFEMIYVPFVLSGG